MNNNEQNIVGYDPNTGAPIYGQPAQPMQPQQPMPQPMGQQPIPQPMQPQPNYQPQGGPIPQPGMPPQKKKFPIWGIILIVLGVFFLIGLGVTGCVVGLVKTLANANQYVCESPEGSITLTYNENGILAYTAEGITYDLDEQQDVAERLGIDQYLKDFNDWFEANTSGTCKVVSPSSSEEE